VATGRNKDVLASLAALGADVTIPLGDGGDAFEEALKEQFGGDGIDIVLDYLWGPSAERIIRAGAKAGKEGVPIRFVNIGSMSGGDVTLPSAALRSSALQLMGSGIGSVGVERLVKAIDEVMQAAAPGGFRMETKTFPLADVERVWAMKDASARSVFATAAGS